MDKIDSLHPKIKDEVRKLVNHVNANVLTGSVKMLVTQGLRTFAEQDTLYAKKPKVTNAKGGQSIHNYGLAFDFCLVDGKTTIWDVAKDFDRDAKADWLEVVKVFKDAGYVWGGDFRSFKDAPHFEKTFGMDWHKLFDLKIKQKLTYIEF